MSKTVPWGLLAFLVMFLGGVFTLAGFQQHQRRQVLLNEPVKLKLADLLRDGIGENKHICLADFSFGRRYVTETKDGHVTRAWVPIFPKPIAAGPLKIEAVIETVSVTDDDQWKKPFFRKATITGICSPNPVGLGQNGDKLFDMHMKSPRVWCIEEGLVLPSREHVFYSCLLPGIVFLLGLTAWIVVLFSKRKQRRATTRNAELLGDTPKQNGEKLGDLEAEYQAGSGMHLFALVCAILLATGASVVSVFLAMHWHDRGAIILATITALVALGLIAAIVILFRRLSWRLAIHANGFATYSGPAETDKLVDAVLWEDIRSYLRFRFRMNGILVRDEVHLELQSGRKVKLEAAYRDFASLAASIREQSYPYRLAEAARLLQNGQPMPFGAINLRKEGLQKGREVMPWSELTGVGIQETSTGQQLVVDRVGKRTTSFSFGQLAVPNTDVLLSLSEKFRELTSPRQQGETAPSI